MWCLCQVRGVKLELLPAICNIDTILTYPRQISNVIVTELTHTRFSVNNI